MYLQICILNGLPNYLIDIAKVKSTERGNLRRHRNELKEAQELRLRPQWVSKREIIASEALNA